jgi:anti-sigma factor RsiW
MVSDPAKLECREVVELLTEFLSDAVPPEDRARLEQHLLVCPPCTLHLAQLKTTIGLTRELGRADDSAVAPAPVIDLFRRWKAK